MTLAEVAPWDIVQLDELPPAQWWDIDVIGTVYLLHFDSPFGHAKHYLGWAKVLPRRLAKHGTSEGANLMLHVRQAGITWRLARTWENVTPRREVQLKKQGGRGRMCPLCGVKPMRPKTRRSVR